MPSAGYGARDNGKRVGGNEEVGGEVGGKSGVLHADFNTDGPLLRCSEMEYLADEEAYGIA